MGKVNSPEDLSTEDLRQLLVEKRRKARLEHLKRFRKTGRVVRLAAEGDHISSDTLHSTTQVETDLNEIKFSPGVRVKRSLDRLLFVVEMLAVIGLFFVIFSGVRLLGDLNAEFSESMSLTTITSTPALVPLVLPSGHTPPNSPGGSHPNPAEIPNQLLPLYQAMEQLPSPTPGPEQATRIQIPSLNIDAPIVQGDGWEQLKKGVAQHIGSADPGQAGNIVLSAHNDVYGELFRYLDQMENGDQVIIFTAHHSFTYIVTNIEIVTPSDVEVMAATADPTLTLISCYPYWVDNKRIIVQASLLDG